MPAGAPTALVTEEMVTTTRVAYAALVPLLVTATEIADAPTPGARLVAVPDWATVSVAAEAAVEEARAFLAERPYLSAEESQRTLATHASW